MRFKRTVAKVKIRRRRKQLEKHDAEMRKEGMARNKALKEAGRAAEKAGAHEKRRAIAEKKEKAVARQLAIKTKEKVATKKRRAERVKKARKTLKGIGKSLGPIYKVVKGK